MAIDPKKESERIRDLAAQRQTPANREQLVEALHSKWEGVQIAAARALVEWGDDKSLQAIRALLQGRVARGRDGGATGTIAAALAPHLRDDDVDWVVNLYFIDARRAARDSIRCLFWQLPAAATLHAIERIAKQADIAPGEVRMIRDAMAYGARQRAAAKPTPTRRRRPTPGTPL